MDSYKLYNVVRPLLNFLEQLTNWYVRLNRSRMKGEEGQDDQIKSLNILFDVLLNTCVLMSCITPFITEHMYQNLKNGISEDNKDLNQESIHFLQIPEYSENLLNEAVETRVGRMISAIENGRLIRERKNISLKTPLSSVTIVDSDPVSCEDFRSVEYYILEELNCLELIVESNEEEFVTYKCEPDNRTMGQALKKAYDKNMKAKIASLPSQQLREYLLNGTTTVDGTLIQEGWLKVEKVFIDAFANSEQHGCASNMTSSVLLNTVLDENLKKMGYAREVTNKIQKLRK